MIKRISVLLIALTGCASQQGALLQWSSDSGQSHQYETTMDKFPPEYEITDNAFELSANPEQIDETIAQLKSVRLPEHLPMLTTVKKIDDKSLEVKTLSVAPVFTGEPANEEEKLERKILKEMEGAIQLLATMDPSGNVLSYYLKQKQKNLVSLFFKLPEEAVNVGDEWDIPVGLIELGNGYIVENAEKIAKATLLKVRHDDQLGNIAEILYLVGEKLEGKFELKPNPAAPKFTISASYVAYGEFLLDKGYWNLHIGQLAFGGSGNLALNTKKIHALRLVQN